MISEKKVANAMGGKTARACDGCLRKRARWYCAADDAFLCQGCDSSVHSANQLASRHERIRLEVASSKPNGMVSDKDTVPVWHQGFTRKARTPRTNKAMLLQQAKEADKVLNSNESLVPEMNSEEGSLDVITEEQLLYQVPVFDPFAVELDDDVIGSEGKVPTAEGNGEENMIVDGFGQEKTCDFDDLHGLLPSDMDLAEFAADVESLLGGGNLDEDSSAVKELGLLDCKEENDTTAVCFGDKIAMKIKDEEVEGVTAIDWNFDYESLVIGDEEEKPVPETDITMMNTKYCKSEMKKNVSLKLNYDAVITAWASQGCPWTNGSRPEFNPNCWPNCTGSCCKDVHYPYKGLLGCNIGGRFDGGRKARVSRYREKRRTRLFSKKIRYEVRKLNAEKRPRMKGRFVKRTSFVGTNINAFPNYLNI